MTGDDRGLRAVLRVRDVRERDGRLGVRSALTEQVEARRRRERFEASQSLVADDSGAGFAAALQLGALVGERVAEARADESRASTAVDHARDHLVAARRQVQTVEALLVRRAERRREALRRQEQRELDDLAAQRWIRGQEEGR
ncbi:flagellar FliJ family protein [Aeromicrobium phragmitis]|uniref:flagellar FliJ family protein n=1 Tax=Aeromicrobium phragmitis TaxID=2478914 RepID=UPI00140E3AAC|nr:flagellar FliJ family protein [Aeromicrobium phragmitis]